MAEKWLTSKIISGAGINFVSENSKNSADVEHSSCCIFIIQPPNNEQAEECIKFVKRTKRRCFEYNRCQSRSLTIRSTLIHLGLPIPATKIFNSSTDWHKAYYQRSTNHQHYDFNEDHL